VYEWAIPKKHSRMQMDPSAKSRSLTSLKYLKRNSQEILAEHTGCLFKELKEAW
jgi:hypothetical protein